MARIISGGLKDSNAVKSGQNNSVNTENSKEQSQESWPAYGLRNLAKAPALAYATARSGLGLGNLAELIYRKDPLSSEENKKQNLSRLRTTLPTFEQAREEIPDFVPQYFKETRPGDEYAEFAVSELPFIAAGGGFKSLANLGRSAVNSLGILGGSLTGHAIGGELGELLGDREIGEALGGLSGGISGSALTHGAFNRPSKTLSPQVLEAEKGAFNLQKANKIAQVENELGPQIAAKTSEYKKSLLDLPKEKSAFETAKKDRINTVKKEISSYNNKIKEVEKTRQPLYEKATKLESGAKGNAQRILNTINDITQDILNGVGLADRKKIYDNVNSLQRAITHNELSLSKAKTFQKNFNDQIYNFGESTAFKRQMNKLNSSINEFIAETGSPEHTQAWQQAENAHKELIALKEGKKEFVDARKSIISDLSKEKFPSEKELYYKQNQREIKKSLDLTDKEYKDFVKSIGKETYEDFVKSEKQQQALANALTGKVLGGVNKYGAYGLGSALYFMGFGAPSSVLGIIATKIGQLGLNEYRAVRNVFKNHPDIASGYVKLLKDATKGDAAKIINRANSLGNELQQQAEEQSNESNNTKRGIIKGGLK